MGTMAVGMAGELKIDSGSLRGKKEEIEHLRQEFSALSQENAKEIFAASRGESAEATEEAISIIQTTTGSFSLILEGTSAYLAMIDEEFKESDEAQAMKFDLAPKDVK